MKPEQERVHSLLKDTVSLLCKNGLSFTQHLKIEGVLGITVDNDVFIVHIDDKFEEEKPEKEVHPDSSAREEVEEEDTRQIKNEPYYEDDEDLILIDDVKQEPQGTNSRKRSHPGPMGGHTPQKMLNLSDRLAQSTDSLNPDEPPYITGIMKNIDSISDANPSQFDDSGGFDPSQHPHGVPFPPSSTQMSHIYSGTRKFSGNNRSGFKATAYVCMYCRKEFRHRQSLWRHKMSFHAQEKLLEQAALEASQALSTPPDITDKQD